jgi:hypothetical protein
VPIHQSSSFNAICYVLKSNNTAGKKQQHIIHPGLPGSENAIFVVFSNQIGAHINAFWIIQWSLLLHAAADVG